ncbi:MAG: LacI family DNA-binding transcriptional regulator [Rectinemataceae bacterium]
MPTIHDIAKEAGVSIASVSRVLNELPVREETMKKVQAAVRKLEYVPNFFARGLSGAESRSIGVLITSMTNSYYMEITEAIERRLRERDFTLLLCSTDLDEALERRYLKEHMSRRVDGCIVIDPAIGNVRSGFFKGMAAQLPLVLVQPDPDIRDLHSVIVDQREGMHEVMDYFIAQKHEDIAFVRGLVGYSYDIKEEVWRARLVGQGQEARQDRIVGIPDGNVAEAIAESEAAVSKLLSVSPRPSAIFCCNDLMARGAMKAAARAGIPVPQELSICGHDNSILAISGSTGLSSVDLKMRSQGRSAVDLLFQAMEGKDPEPRRILIAPQLVIRDSTGPRHG